MGRGGTSPRIQASLSGISHEPEPLTRSRYKQPCPDPTPPVLDLPRRLPLRTALRPGSNATRERRSGPVPVHDVCSVGARHAHPADSCPDLPARRSFKVSDRIVASMMLWTRSFRACCGIRFLSRAPSSLAPNYAWGGNLTSSSFILRRSESSSATSYLLHTPSRSAPREVPTPLVFVSASHWDATSHRG